MFSRRNGAVAAYAVSGMAAPADIAALAQAHAGAHELPRLVLVPPRCSYERPAAGFLPDGTPLDPYYAAKALPYVRTGDLLWVTGCRPLAAFPALPRARKAAA